MLVMVGVMIAVAVVTVWALKWPAGFERVWNLLFRREKL